MSEDGNPTETPNQEGLVADCLKTIEDYRGKNISKWEAVSQIFSAVRSTTASADSQQRSAAGDTYLAMLDGHDRLLAGANTWGQSGIEPFDEEAEDRQEEFVGETRSKRTLSQSS